MTTVRRTFLKNTAAAAMAAALPSLSFAQAPARALFAPQSGAWRTFDVTTRVDILKPEGVTRSGCRFHRSTATTSVRWKTAFPATAKPS